MHNNNNDFKIGERRRRVASMLAQSMTETEIAEQLNVDQLLSAECQGSQRNVTAICL